MTRLNPQTIEAVFGTSLPSAHWLAWVRADVERAIAEYQADVAAGVRWPVVRRIEGRPLADWLPLDEVGRLLSLGGPR